MQVYSTLVDIVEIEALPLNISWLLIQKLICHMLKPVLCAIKFSLVSPAVFFIVNLVRSRSLPFFDLRLRGFFLAANASHF